MKEFFTKIKNKFKRLSIPHRVNPHTYWNIVLKIFFVLIIILIIFSLYLLYKIKNQQMPEIVPATTETPSLVNDKLLKKVNKLFEDKSTIQKEIEGGSRTYIDPGI